MAQLSLQGNACNSNGELPQVGEKAPNFSLTRQDLSQAELASFAGQRKILSIVPSLDTDVCAQSTRIFNQRASSLDNVVILTISADLPFAQARFCGAEGIENVQTLSTFRSQFADDYGINIVDGPLAGLTGRAILVLDENDTVIHRQLVTEITDEPDYDAALSAL